jgi:4'-phosphopantetheinyl transferase
MRMILAQYLGVPPKNIAFAYAERGKPQLSPELRESGVKFNLSHSLDRALLAVTLESAIGVDLEYIDKKFASEEIAESFFSPMEIGVLRGIPEEERAAAFFSCWTRKEAYIKAVGDGLAIPLHGFDVAFGPGVSPRLLRVNASSGEVSRWSMYNLPAPAGYAAALVVEGRSHEIQQCAWPDNAML